MSNTQCTAIEHVTNNGLSDVCNHELMYKPQQHQEVVCITAILAPSPEHQADCSVSGHGSTSHKQHKLTDKSRLQPQGHLTIALKHFIRLANDVHTARQSSCTNPITWKLFVLLSSKQHSTLISTYCWSLRLPLKLPSVDMFCCAVLRYPRGAYPEPPARSA